MDVFEACIQNVLNARENGWLRNVCILSNAGLFMFARRVEVIAKRYDFQYHACCWPGLAKPHPEVFRMAMATIGASRENTGVIGDQQNTDILGANLAGFDLSILVPSLKPVPWWKKYGRQRDARRMRALGLSWPHAQ